METIKLNITQLNTLVKRIIDAEEFLQTIAVYGEVTNFKISAGNAYFDIKEEGAQLACIKFGAYNLDLKNGDMVLLTGRLNYYVKTGKLSFIANVIEPYGLGELYKRYLILKEKLAAEGLFDERYKKELPRFARTVGVVTSETGAVIRDIVHVAQKKNKFTDIIVYPAKVQGVNAEDEIISGINYFENTDVDVVIIARGGGSFEDLAPFNTEKLARAVFAAKKPIISAVGHETDFSLTDFVADMRAPTPSVAAELAFFDYKQTKDSLISVIADICKNAEQYTASRSQYLQNLLSNISQNTKNVISNKTLSLSGLINSIVNNFTDLSTRKKVELTDTLAKIEKSNPLNLLKSGYAVISKDNSRISSVKNLDVGDNIKIRLSDGTINAAVTNKEN